MKLVQTSFFVLLALLKVGVFPGVSLADAKPCRGFVGSAYTRGRFLALCGEPDEIHEQETKRRILWRYRGYAPTVVRSARVNGRDSVAEAAQTSSRRKAPRVDVDEELFRTILDEASAQSKEPAAAK